MRSRYAAFALMNADYVLTTWHPSTRPARLDFEPGRTWMLLRIIAHEADGDRATVEFIARSKIAGQMHELHEISRFVRESNHWLYVDGQVG
jgi:SEC-C motif domain protein